MVSPVFAWRNANHYLITSVHLPTVVQIIEASREQPYLGLKLGLDLREISQMMVDSNLPAPRVQKSGREKSTTLWCIGSLNMQQGCYRIMQRSPHECVENSACIRSGFSAGEIARCGCLTEGRDTSLADHTYRVQSFSGKEDFGLHFSHGMRRGRGILHAGGDGIPG